jgi:hypothetical protein
MDMKHSNITNSNTLPNKVEVDLNMLGALMLDGVGRHADNVDLVTIYQGGSAQWRV